jgi:hypothetical protein
MATQQQTPTAGFSASASPTTIYLSFLLEKLNQVFEAGMKGDEKGMVAGVSLLISDIGNDEVRRELWSYFQSQLSAVDEGNNTTLNAVAMTNGMIMEYLTSALQLEMKEYGTVN